VLSDHHRSRRREEVALDRWKSSEDLDVQVAEPEAVLHNDRIHRQVQAWIRTQPQSTREFCVQRFESDRSQRQAAVALGLSHRHVRTIEGRIRNGLGHILHTPGATMGKTARRRQR
jgi:DNA-directed RNA polymerase specialized sigma24 family protein